MPIYKQNGKKNGLQKYRVIVSYTDPAGKYKQLSKIVYGQAEARQAEADLLAECKKPVSSRLTVDDLFLRYCAVKQMDIRPATMEMRKSFYKNRIGPYIGDLRLDRLNAAAMENWKARVDKCPIAISTKRETYATLNMILRYAVAVDLINKNPLDKITNFRDKDFAAAAPGDLHFYTPEQFALYIAAAKAEAAQTGDMRFYLFFLIAFYTGMRKSEINALQWKSIDGDIVHVCKNVSINSQGKKDISAPKNKSSFRDIRVPPFINNLLFRQKTEMQKNPSFSDDFFVCGGAELISDYALQYHHEKYIAAAGLPHIRIHDFRHSHASLLINEGISIQEIARRLGHSNIEMTLKVYAHLYPREEDRALKVLNALNLY